MKKYFLISVLLIQNLVSSSQNTIYVGNKSYPSTSTWEFAELSLEFGRSTISSGIILVTVKEDQFYQQYFGAILSIYLKNGKLISLNKIANDRVNGYISAAYSVNSINLKMLKNSDIDRVRYTVKNELGRSNNYLVANEIIEFKEIKMPVPDAKYMSEMERFRRNIQSENLGGGLSDDPFKRYESYTYYYRYETIKISKGIIKTSTDINSLY